MAEYQYLFCRVQVRSTPHPGTPLPKGATGRGFGATFIYWLGKRGGAQIGPIRLGWFAIVWPCLVLNYFGQGAWVIANPPDPASMHQYKPFYGLVPPSLLIPMVVVFAMDFSDV